MPLAYQLSFTLFYRDRIKLSFCIVMFRHKIAIVKCKVWGRFPKSVGAFFMGDSSSGCSYPEQLMDPGDKMLSVHRIGE